jgi:molybdopterin-guanine dinucleotide biosynthesis protein A
MVGAAGRNVGKTEFACSLIRKFSTRCKVIGIKVTAIESTDGSCPHGGSGCGVCSSLEGNYCITEETESQSDKDTQRMLAAGAETVYWLRVLKTHLEEGGLALLDTIGDGAVSVCESNSFRSVAVPDLFVMLRSSQRPDYKPSAQSVGHHADKTVSFDGSNFDIDIDEIQLIDGRWANKMHATAIIMAGGKSLRMGRDKSMLPFEGKPIIEHIFKQLDPHFDQILISSNDTAGYEFLDAKVISDREQGLGPLMGIASAIRASANELNFVTACDIPDIPISLIRRMFREAGDFDVVMPRRSRSKFEPLFAMYKKSTLAAIDDALACGIRKIIVPLEKCKIKYIDISQTEIKNLNTKDDYRKFIEKE